MRLDGAQHSTATTGCLWSDLAAAQKPHARPRQGWAAAGRRPWRLDPHKRRRQSHAQYGPCGWRCRAAHRCLPRQGSPARRRWTLLAPRPSARSHFEDGLHAGTLDNLRGRTGAQTPIFHCHCQHYRGRYGACPRSAGVHLAPSGAPGLEVALRLRRLLQLPRQDRQSDQAKGARNLRGDSRTDPSNLRTGLLRNADHGVPVDRWQITLQPRAKVAPSVANLWAGVLQQLQQLPLPLPPPLGLQPVVCWSFASAGTQDRCASP